MDRGVLGAMNEEDGRFGCLYGHDCWTCNELKAQEERGSHICSAIIREAGMLQDVAGSGSLVASSAHYIANKIVKALHNTTNDQH